MQNKFKGRVIFSDNYQSTIDSIKLINKSVSNQATIKKNNADSIDVSSDSDIRIIQEFNQSPFFTYT